MSPGKDRSKTDAESFDSRLGRLESIVGELESGGVPLETAIERYEEGIELLRACRATLDGYKKRVEELSAGADGGLAPYASDPDAGADS